MSSSRRGYPCDLAAELGKDDTVAVDVDCETTIENVYAIGKAVRMPRIKAAISVGHGASATIDILSKERNEMFHDYGEALHVQ